MLPRTATSVRWRRRGLWAGAALTASYVYVAYAGRGFAHGGSAMGIAYGALGVLAILVLLYFGVRKRSYRSTWGTLDGWLQAHIYIGLLSALVILFHTGFRFRDRVAVAAFAVLLAVVASGLVGAFFYSSLPRRLSEVEGDLMPADLAAQIEQLAAAMVRLATSRSQPFQQVCRGLLAETAPGRLAGWKVMLGGAGRAGAGAAARGMPAGGAGGASGQPAPWAAELGRVPAGEQEELRQLLVLSRQRRELLLRLVAQQRYRNLLGAWLYVHLPLSIALLVLVAAHLVAVSYYYAWR
jgi:hypothetical protein